MFISFEYSSCLGNLIWSTSCLFLVWFGDQEWHCDKNHNHLFWILLCHKYLESTAALRFWDCQLYVLIQKKKFKFQNSSSNILKITSNHYIYSMDWYEVPIFGGLQSWSKIFFLTGVLQVWLGCFLLNE